MIYITDTISLRDEEIEEQFIRSSGPGGQHVNKTSTGVQLRFDVNGSSLPGYVRVRVKKLAGTRLTTDGVVVITATNNRSQRANRDEALERLVELIREATKRPKYRAKTKPSRAARARRVDSKKQRGATKKLRGRVRDSD